MINLFTTEFRKFFTRDIVRLFALIFAGASFLSGVGAFVTTSPLPEAEAAKADAAIRAGRRDVEASIRECRNPSVDPRLLESLRQRGIPSHVIEDFEVRELRKPSRRECLERLRPSAVTVNDFRFQFPGTFVTGVTIAIFPLALISLVLGATFLGAEWSAGTMTTLLSWEPRRIRLFTAKLAVIISAVFMSFLLAELLLGLGMMPAALSRGTFAGIDRFWWEELIDITWRGASGCALAALLGLSVAALTRNTVAAVGGLFAYLLIVENVLRAVTGALSPWLITNNFLVAFQPSQEALIIVGRSPEEALALLSFYCLGLVLLAGILFWRRDVA